MQIDRDAAVAAIEGRTDAPVPLVRRDSAVNFLNLIAPRPVPLASFASVMGVSGLGLAWRLAARSGDAPTVIGELIIAGGAVLFFALTLVWLARIATHPHEIRTELNVAITASYVGTIVISFSLLAVSAVPYSRPIAFALWLCAALGGVGFLVYLLGRWVEHGIEIFELTPAIFIPVVGNATSVYAAVPLGMVDFGWASFSVGALCWLALAPIVLDRLVAVPPRARRNKCVVSSSVSIRVSAIRDNNRVDARTGALDSSIPYQRRLTPAASATSCCVTGRPKRAGARGCEPRLRVSGLMRRRIPTERGRFRDVTR